MIEFFLILFPSLLVLAIAAKALGARDWRWTVARCLLGLGLVLLAARIGGWL